MSNRNSNNDSRTASDDQDKTRRMESARRFWGQQKKRENTARGR